MLVAPTARLAGVCKRLWRAWHAGRAHAGQAAGGGAKRLESAKGSVNREDVFGGVVYFRFRRWAAEAET